MWDEILDPVPEAPWREHLAHIAAWLEGFGGRALIEPPRIEWHAPSTFASILAVDDPAIDTADPVSDDKAHGDDEPGEAPAGAPADPSNRNEQSVDEPRAADGSADVTDAATSVTDSARDTDSVAESGRAGTAADSAATKDSATATKDSAATNESATAAESATGESADAASAGTGSSDADSADADSAGGDSANGDADGHDGEATVAIKTTKTDDLNSPTVRIPTQQQRGRGGRAASPGRSVASATRDLPKRVADDDPNFDLASDPR
jgi:hypothetical protein